MLIGVPIVIVNLLTQAAVGGLNFAPKAMKFKGNRINPISGLKRMFSMKALVELGKSILKVVLLFGIATAIMFQIMPGVLNFPSLTLPKMLEVMRYVIPLLICALLVVLAIIAAIDYFWQRYTHIKQLRMSRQDLKDEFKQTEGSPEVKAKIRRMQAETATRGAQQREALDDVANATAVITNPTHFAVALRYEVGDQAAPVILAMGRGIIAQQIIERAETAQVSVFRSPILARALYFTGDIGAEISQSLYNAVAVVLAYLYRLEKGEALQLPDVDVPEDMQFNEFGKLLSEDT
jgi:flagellar biosynthetic protein FlhB